MAVLYLYEAVDARMDEYDRIAAGIRAAGVPEGAVLHVAGERDGGGLVVVEVWESQAAHDRWSPVLTEKIRAAGGPPRPAPRVMQVHNMMLAPAAKAVVT